MLVRADVRFANLEAPLLDRGRALFSTGVRLKMPASAVGLVRRLGVEAVTLANNHMMDFGPDGVRSTLSALGGASIRHVGAGLDGQDAARPTFLDVKGLRLAFLGVCDEHGGGADGAPGVNLLRPGRLLADVRRATKRADHVIVGVHTGIEFTRAPEPFFLSLARRLIDAGASVVAGHHPQVPQGVTRHGGGVIACSLGDFVFDLSRADGDLTASQKALNALHPVLEVALEKGGIAGYAVHWLRCDGGRFVPAPEGAAAGAELEALLADPARLADEAQASYGEECFGFLYKVYEALYLAVRRGKWGRLPGLAWWLPTLARRPKRRVLRHAGGTALSMALRRLRGAR